jgi:hypothetical protein
MMSAGRTSTPTASCAGNHLIWLHAVSLTLLSLKSHSTDCTACMTVIRHRLVMATVHAGCWCGAG